MIWISEELGAEILPTLANAEWNIMGSLADKDIPCCHFMPHRTEGEGFFCAILRKEGNKEDADKVNADSIIKRANKVLRVLPLQGDEEKPVAAVDVDHQTALQYLHGEALRLPAETPRGIIPIIQKGQHRTAHSAQPEIQRQEGVRFPAGPALRPAVNHGAALSGYRLHHTHPATPEEGAQARL